MNATGVWADRIRPQELYAEEEMPVIRPSRGTHITLPRELLDVRAGAIVPGGRRAHRVRAAVAGPDAGGHDGQRLRGRVDHVPPADEDVAYLLEAVNAFFATDLGARRPERRLRGRAAADLDGRPEEVGRHLAQGGAVRDELGARHDHRRQAHHLAADGEARGGPGRGARGTRGAVPHAGDPARDAGRAGPPPGGRRAWTRTPGCTWRPGTGTPRTW